MKLCENCGQPLAELISKCPSCGSEVGKGRQFIDDYRIVTVLHEGYASFLCKAIRERTDERVMIRLFTPQSGVDETVADRLRRELEELKKLPADRFVQHYAIRLSEDNLWYRISEWIDALNWGELMRSGRFEDYRAAFDFFAKIAANLAVLHEAGHIIPHLILDDIMAIESDDGTLTVKIDYKFSRFLNPKLDRPGPNLKHLLECHPDIIDQRPLDRRSDIWSLGKIFIELLTADLDICDHLETVDELPLPQEAKILFKTMLAEDPALRPQTMEEVAELLSRITTEKIEAARTRQVQFTEISAKTIRGLKTRQWVIIATIVLAVIGGAFFSINYLGDRKKDDTAILEDFANQYAGSVAFVLVDYWLRDEKAYAYRNRSEGTAFLVDADGLLLTNRHVACPWLEDMSLHLTAQQLQQSGRTPRFGFRIFLWFDGAKAFNRSAGLIDSPDLADAYFVDSAYRSDGTPKLTIAGVAKPPVQTRQLVASPLRDDFAVLKIDRVPKGLQPLPIKETTDPLKIPKLSPIVALGFPLGSRTQEATVNVSVTRGHVRRTFENLIQIDGSIYGGNSGGPMIDLNGQVIGIISGVATDRAPGLIPMVTPLWDLGMVFPIGKAADFLNELKAGKVKWNGELDLSIEAKLKGIFEAADAGRWAEAMALADKELESSFDPQLVMAAAIMHFCAEDHEGARRLFDTALSMDSENSIARLMLFVLDWATGRAEESAHRQELVTLDWRSPAEFHGYLAQVLAGMVDETAAVAAWDSEVEQSWLHFIAGLRAGQRKQWIEAEKVLKTATLMSDPETWEYFLSRNQLDRVQQKRLAELKADPGWGAYQQEIEAFQKEIQKEMENRKGRKEKLAELKSRLQDSSATVEQKLQLLEKVLEISPENGEAIVGMAFFLAAGEDWERALEKARHYLKRKGRENARRLSAGLLEVEILRRTGQKAESQKLLEAYHKQTRDSWYRAIAEGLLGKRTIDALKNEAGNRPEDLLTLYVGFGFWTEADPDPEKAIEYYKLALESFLDTWFEFDFSKARINRLRKTDS